MNLLDRILHRTHDPEHVERQRRLAQAEAELQHLQERSQRALESINKRDRQNHWQESIDRMIHDARWWRA